MIGIIISILIVIAFLIAAIMLCCCYIAGKADENLKYKSKGDV